MCDLCPPRGSVRSRETLPAFHCSVGKVSPADSAQFLVPEERDEKSFQQPTVLAGVSLHREGTFYRAEYTDSGLRRLGLEHTNLSGEGFPGCFKRPSCLAAGL